MFQKGQWIWYETPAKADSYGEFYDTFSWSGQSARLTISCDSNYAAYINGELAAFGQYADFEHYKVADEVDVTAFCKEGKNHLAVIVWHYQAASSAYCPQKAGLIYELRADSADCVAYAKAGAASCGSESADGVLAFSNPLTRCRESRAYRIGQQKWITGQMGFSFDYNAKHEDGWMLGEGANFSPAVTVNKTSELVLRPNRQLALEGRCASALIAADKVGTKNPDPADVSVSDPDSVSAGPSADGAQDGLFRYLFDLGKEEVGFLDLELFSECAQPLTIAYSEYLFDRAADPMHIIDITPRLPLTDSSAIRVPQIIGGRDFSVIYHAVSGQNHYMNPFRRLGARYLEIRCEKPIQIAYAGIRPTMYPLKRTDFSPKSELDKRIYEICSRTLELCLHEHYEDCPWREQCFYAMDSRNQMLCGYIAFKEYEAARAGLSLFAQDRHESGFLSICCPNASDAHLFIPSFSLHYFTAVDEYTQYSGDTTLAQEVYGKLTSLLENFAAHKIGSDADVRGAANATPNTCSLLSCLPGHAWNFYEWRPMLDGSLGAVINGGKREAPDVDLILNALYVLALRHMTSIAAAVGKDGARYLAEAEELCEKIRKAFYRPETGLFSTFVEIEHYSETANALAILCGAASGDAAACIAEQMTGHPERFVPASLSMKCFPYDALLAVDREKYGTWVLDQIRSRYQIMLDAGSTTVWEDEEGPAAFEDAGSLCHGWSSIPIYYYHILQDLL